MVRQLCKHRPKLGEFLKHLIAVLATQFSQFDIAFAAIEQHNTAHLRQAQAKQQSSALQSQMASSGAMPMQGASGVPVAGGGQGGPMPGQGAPPGGNGNGMDMMGVTPQ